MPTTTITVRKVAKAIPGGALTTTDNVSVSIDTSVGEDARRAAVAAAVVASDSTSSTTHEIHYNGYPIPAWDYPAGHVF